jgi:hypothetical protein
LFRRQAGKHIDYIVDGIKSMLEHYAETTTIKISIEKYNSEEGKYRVSALSTVTVRSYLDDVETTYTSYIAREEVAAPPGGGEPNRLVYARAGGHPVGISQEFQDSINRPISCRIDRNGTCEVVSLMSYWVKANDEPNTHTPRRYTQLLTLHFENLMSSGEPVEVKLSLDGTNWVTERLDHGVLRQVAEIADIKPGSRAYDYRLLAP